MKLSIITPYYNTLPYIQKLNEVLEGQLDETIEWIIVDDGCNEKELDKLKAKVIHLPENSGGASKPRNVGLDMARGKYIAFIDSDDIVSKDYIYRIIKAMDKKTDIIYLSWISRHHNIRIIDKPPKWNCAVWCRVYKRDLIGDVRFDENLRIAEDWKFNEQIKPRSSCYIEQRVYLYNSERKGSLIRSEKVKRNNSRI